ncbi:MAG: PD-(D/E)XK nuclease-like domain-containing protein [Phycisphaerae bacterium]|nr:PD-(D/E)XK nuclease-like domain-containing protein [Phycisphaerae bacterium]
MASTIDLGFLVREPADVYHAKAKDFLSAHALNEFRRCPLLYRRKQLGLVPDRDTTAYIVGRGAHTLILEGRQRYERAFAIGGPINPRTGQPFGSQTKAFAQWATQQSKEVLSDTHAALVEQMAAAVTEHRYAGELLAEGIAEGVVRCEYGGHRCQARVDWINPDADCGIVDLKTADELDSFEASMRAFGYLYQVAFYRALIARASGHVLPVHIIAVEKREPFRCGVWQIAPAVLDAAQRDNEEAMNDLRQCRETGDWFTRYEALRRVDRL